MIGVISDFLWTNKEWFIPLVGVVLTFVAVLLTIFGFFTKDEPIIINQIGQSKREVKRIAKSVFRKHFSELQEKAKQEAIKNRDQYVAELSNNIDDKLTPKELNCFQSPDIQFALMESIIIASRTGSKEKRRILSDLIINRVKNHGVELGEIVYNEAIKAISIITTQQLKILSLVEITSSLIYQVINKDIILDSIKKIIEAVDQPIQMTSMDIDHLKISRLLISTFPYEIDRTILKNDLDGEHSELISKCLAFLETQPEMFLNNMKLTPIGKVIAQTEILITMGINLNNLHTPPLVLADFHAKNIIAKGDITAYG